MASSKIVDRLRKVLAVGAVACSLPYIVPLPRFEEHDPRELAPSDQFLSVEGLLTHYRSWGTGKPVVMIHGFWSWSFTWEPLAELLAGSNFRCLALDLKGYGLTEKPQGADYSHRALARFTISFMDALGVDTAVLIGSSMGGNVALHAALRYPDRFAGLVLLAPAVFVPWRTAGTVGMLLHFPPLRRIARHLLRRYAKSEVATEALKRSYFDVSHVTPSLIELYRTPLRTAGWDEAIIGALRESRQNSVVDRLPNVRQPTLAIWGKHDRVVPPQLAQRLAMSMPQCQIQFIEKAGHLPHEERPDATAEAIGSFLKSEALRTWA
jgi:pimeloyl-ACP methyl ester carboxylesterase